MPAPVGKNGAIARALTMSIAERRERHTDMLRRLERYPVSVWAENFVTDLEGRKHASAA